MDYEKWIEKYKPIMTRQGSVVLYETSGEDIKKIRNTEPEYIWTLVDTDDENLAILPGMHYVNRIAYIITKVPHNEEQCEEVLYA